MVIDARIVGVHQKAPSIMLADIGEDDIFELRPPIFNSATTNLDRKVSFLHVWLQYEMGNNPQVKVRPSTTHNENRVAFLEDVPGILQTYETMMASTPALWIAQGKESEPIDPYQALSEKILLDYGGNPKRLTDGRMRSAHIKRDIINTGHFFTTIDKMPLARQVLWSILDYSDGWLRMHSQGNPEIENGEPAVHFTKSYGYPLRIALATLLLRDGLLDVRFNPGESHGFWCFESEIVYKSTEREKAEHSFSPNYALRSELAKALLPFEKEREKNRGFYTYVGKAKHQF